MNWNWYGDWRVTNLLIEWKENSRGCAVMFSPDGRVWLRMLSVSGDCLFEPTWWQTRSIDMFRARSGWIQFAKRGQLVGGRAFCHTNNKLTTNADHNAYASVRDYEAYRQLDKLDFMTAAKILFTTPPKKKKFGYLLASFNSILSFCLHFLVGLFQAFRRTSSLQCFWIFLQIKSMRCLE